MFMSGCMCVYSTHIQDRHKFVSIYVGGHYYFIYIHRYMYVCMYAIICLWSHWVYRYACFSVCAIVYIPLATVSCAGMYM